MKTENLKKPLTPEQALNKAFLKIPPDRFSIELFKKNLITLLDHINDKESEEFHKNLVSAFLKDTYYNSEHFINTKGRNDLVIHNGKKAESSVGVIIEAKKVTNRTEMIELNNINKKAFQELVLYFLRERISDNNNEINYLIVTNIYEWFIFDANVFEKHFAQNKDLVNKFIKFEEGRLSNQTTDHFYKEIAEPYIAAITSEIPFTHFNIRDYDKPLRNENKKDDDSLIALFKLLSPEHLLKLPFSNDSNQLDKIFYSELLHIIGLTETKEGSKKLIERKKEGDRNSGSLIESAITQIKSLDKLSRIDKVHKYGKDKEERLFNVSLELSITWINRILFLKLLEAQLIKYHQGDKSFSFLSIDKIQNFDDLNSLFFSVLACKQNERDEDIKKIFYNVPYLNSSLFEPTELEQSCFFISQLKEVKLPILSNTVFKDTSGKKKSGGLNTLEYLFEFLNAYNFSSEGTVKIQEDRKTLINASVLGLIFEKINGYKDGSFFTPSFITMYMCRETIRRSIVKKFKENENETIETFEDLKAYTHRFFKPDDIKRFNNLINSLKICDPAVGSGHFLVSALNEIISCKSELKILVDNTGIPLKQDVIIENDELCITDENGKLFEYNPKDKESQRIQETFFHEKQTIIENCLFGVDINLNSAKICSLRLWIELLKNAYYKSNSDDNELETLPNIDINIKWGNSLISRYKLDINIKDALKKLKWNVQNYRNAIMSYRNAQNKEEKHEMENLISEIKNSFATQIALYDPKLKKLGKLKSDLDGLNQKLIFESTKSEISDRAKKILKVTNDIKQIEDEFEEIKNNKIYENAFEWRFEFPEVLNDEGDFIGFDVIIGNPPYLSYYGRFKVDMSKTEEIYYKNNYSFIQTQIIDPKVIKGRFSTVMFFLELALKISSKNNYISYLVDLNIHKQPFDDIRQYLFEHSTIIEIVNDLVGFEDVFSGQSILFYSNAINIDYSVIIKKENMNNIEGEFFKSQLNNTLALPSFVNDTIIQKIYSKKSGVLVDYFPDNLIRTGITFTGMKDKFLVIKDNNKKRALLEGSKSISSQYCKPIVTNYINYDKDLLDQLNKDYANKLDQTKNKKQLWIGLGDSLVFESPKIIVLQTGEKIIATYSDDNLCLNLSLFSISNINSKGDKSSVNLKLILAQLNSKLITYFALNENFIQKRAGSVPQIRLKQLKQLPIIMPDNNISKEIISITDKILLLKQSDLDSDISKLEMKLNLIIYDLYGLTNDEKVIIENLIR